MLTDSSSWNGMTLPSVIDSSWSLCLYVSALEDSTVIHSIVTKDSWCLKKKKKKIILASRFNPHASQCLCYVS